MVETSILFKLQSSNTNAHAFMVMAKYRYFQGLRKVEALFARNFEISFKSFKMKKIKNTKQRLRLVIGIE